MQYNVYYGCTYMYLCYIHVYENNRAFPVARLVENPPANAGDARDISSVSGWGRSPGERNGNLLSILAWQITQTEEPGRLQSMESQRIRHDWACMHTTYENTRNTKLFSVVILEAGIMDDFNFQFWGEWWICIPPNFYQHILLLQ